MAPGDAYSFDVRSADGTSLAVWKEGTGPPLVLVHGVLADHSTFGPLVQELRSSVATFAMDRRGRGQSGDGSEYAIEREFEDVAAVVDAVADRMSAPVALWGHSFGADCAMGGAAQTANVSHLVLYEPGLGAPLDTAAIEAVEQALASDDREAAAEALLVGIVGMSSADVDFLRSSPVWASRLAVVHTVPRELRAEADWEYRAGQFDAISAEAIILAGVESPSSQDDATRRAAEEIRGARIVPLEGQGHMAHQSDPVMVANLLRDFTRS